MPDGLKAIGERGHFVVMDVKAGHRADFGIAQRSRHVPQIIRAHAHVAVADHHHFVARPPSPGAPASRPCRWWRRGRTVAARGCARSGKSRRRSSTTATHGVVVADRRRRRFRSRDNPAGRSSPDSRRRPGSRPRIGFRMLTGGVKSGRGGIRAGCRKYRQALYSASR